MVEELRLRKFAHVATEKDFIQGDDRIIVDVYGEREGIAMIEIEERRRAPVQNVAKIVKWVSRSRGSFKVTLVQVFSKEFYNSKEHRSEEELARFIGVMGRQVFKERFEYIPLRVTMAARNGFSVVSDTVKQIVDALSSNQP